MLFVCKKKRSFSTLSFFCAANSSANEISDVNKNLFMYEEHQVRSKTGGVCVEIKYGGHKKVVRLWAGQASRHVRLGFVRSFARGDGELEREEARRAPILNWHRVKWVLWLWPFARASSVMDFPLNKSVHCTRKDS